MGWTRLIRQQRATLVCAGFVVALLAALWLAFGRAAGASDKPLVALVHDGDGMTHELPLDTDTRLTVTTELGTNTIVVEDGAVRMLEANCPNGTCLHAPAISAPGSQIICLPHQLWIEVVPAGEAGGELDLSLAEGAEDVEADVDLQAR